MEPRDFSRTSRSPRLLAFGCSSSDDPLPLPLPAQSPSSSNDATADSDTNFPQAYRFELSSSSCPAQSGGDGLLGQCSSADFLPRQTQSGLRHSSSTEGVETGQAMQAPADASSIENQTCPIKPSDKGLLEKPLEELTKEDILQLTREDCRRYLKEKGMRRPSWNKSQAIQQVLSLKRLFDSKCEEETRARRNNSHKKVPAEPSMQRQSSNLICPEEANLKLSQQPPLQFQIVLDERVHDERFITSDRALEGVDDYFSEPSPQVGGDSQLTDHVPLCFGISKGVSAYTCASLQCGLSMPGKKDMERKAPPQSIQGAGFAGKHTSMQLTIFYSGMVNVYDDIPEDKAEAIMLLAANCNTAKSSSCGHSEILVATRPTSTPSNVIRPLYVQNSPMAASASVHDVSSTPQTDQPPSRKACLERFLEKRRDRHRNRALCLTSREVAASDLPSQLYSGRMMKKSASHEVAGFQGLGYLHSLVLPMEVQMPTLFGISETRSPAVQMRSNKFPACCGQRGSGKQAYGAIANHFCAGMDLSFSSQHDSSKGS